jgi:hypothetical protein
VLAIAHLRHEPGLGPALRASVHTRGQPVHAVRVSPLGTQQKPQRLRPHHSPYPCVTWRTSGPASF